MTSFNSGREMMNSTTNNPSALRQKEKGCGLDLQTVYLVMIRAYLRQQRQRQVQVPTSKVTHA
jgi:hypothetical protein